MRHLAYRHSVNKSLAETMLGGIRAVLPGPLRHPQSPGGPGPMRARIMVAIGWLIVLVVQAALLVLIAELIEVAHGVMELYLDLAQQQLDLTSLYVEATSPQ